MKWHSQQGGLATAKRMTVALRRLPSKADSRTWRSFTRSELKLESVHQELPRTHVPTYPRVCQDIPEPSRLKQKGLKYFLIGTLCHFIWKSRAQILEEEWRGTKFKLFQVKGEVSTVSDDLGFHVICWCWSSVLSRPESTQVSTRMLPCAYQYYGDADFLSSRTCLQTLSKLLVTGLLIMVLLRLDGQPTHLTWAPQKIYGKLSGGDERRQTQQCRWTEGHYQATWTSITPQQCHKVIASIPCCTDVTVQEEPWPSNQCKMNVLFWKSILLYYKSFFGVIFQYFEGLNFWFSWAINHNHRDPNK